MVASGTFAQLSNQPVCCFSSANHLPQRLTWHTQHASGCAYPATLCRNMCKINLLNEVKPITFAVCVWLKILHLHTLNRLRLGANKKLMASILSSLSYILFLAPRWNDSMSPVQKQHTSFVVHNQRSSPSGMFAKLTSGVSVWHNYFWTAWLAKPSLISNVRFLRCNLCYVDAIETPGKAGDG